MNGIDFTKSDQYLLSIRLSADGFSFSIFNPRSEGEFFFKPYAVDSTYSLTVNIKEMLASSEIFRHTYGQTYVLTDTPRFTLVPFELFEDDEMEELFYCNFGRTDNEIVLCNILGKSNVVVLFGMNKHAHQLLNDFFPHSKYFATSSPLIDYFHKKSRLNNKRLFIYLQKQIMHVFGYDGKRLLLTNSFACEQDADRIYYLLHLWKQSEFDVEVDELFLTGEVPEKEALREGLQTYIRNVSVVHPSSEFTCSAITRRQDVPFDLQTLLACE